MNRNFLLAILVFGFAVLGCSPSNTNTRKEASSDASSASGETLPTTASAYEDREPLTSEKVTTTPLTSRYARRVFKDPAVPDNWHELIIGTGGESEKIYAYFHFVGIENLRFAERDERELRWGLPCAKYEMLAGIPANAILKDAALVKECKDASLGFYLGLKDEPASKEGIDIRGIHFQVKRYKGNLAEIIGMTSDQWNSIRRANMHGQPHELYSLFP
jgi:hypothetical protein